MAKKELKRIAKLEFEAGQAKPGPALAGLGIDMGGFTKAYNDATRDKAGNIIPVIIRCYSDRSFEFTLKTTPSSRMILKAVGLEKGATNALKDTIATITKAQIKEIAEYKLEDLNAQDIDAAMNIIIGTAHNMGIAVEGHSKKVKSSEENLITNENYESQLAEMEAGIATANEESAVKLAEEKAAADEAKESKGDE